MSTSGPSARGASTKHYGRDETSDSLAHLAQRIIQLGMKKGDPRKCVPQFIREQS